ncbi:HNH endonuclease [Fimbriimonas ginsengisoli]|uniref:HNH endonuclease n=1 Tax=Fimbriimonas ginsengisoli Gsoil 348 TaxID=661478 RepID=A0A068NX86_FIMGI|nr:hypothetical protein [Fimbriimonas ginsengisoli]AIE87962.1 HNH endonuclease [Fimbriimonas ginsengisoli Gsoil 348]
MENVADDFSRGGKPPGNLEVLARLLPDLPTPAEAVLDPEEGVRAALRGLVERSLTGPFDFAVVLEDPQTCPNCGGAVSAPKSPYCSEVCRDTAAFVRQFRSSLLNGAIFERERQIGLGQALWKIQGGGYPLRQRLVTPKVLAKVIERDGGKCSVCGAPATEIDHVGSG